MTPRTYLSVCRVHGAAQAGRTFSGHHRDQERRRVRHSPQKRSPYLVIDIGTKRWDAGVVYVCDAHPQALSY